MDLMCAAAARAAQMRAADCRERRQRLATGHRVGPDDVAHAHARLGEAAERAAAASLRLEQVRLQRLVAAMRNGSGPAATVHRRPVAAASEVRARAKGVPFAYLLAGYAGIGGRCSAFELDAFVHAGTDLPEHELRVLDHAVWEYTEFGG
jgi:hypothetical protein